MLISRRTRRAFPTLGRCRANPSRATPAETATWASTSRGNARRTEHFLLANLERRGRAKPAPASPTTTRSTARASSPPWPKIGSRLAAPRAARTRASTRTCRACATGSASAKKTSSRSARFAIATPSGRARSRSAPRPRVPSAATASFARRWPCPTTTRASPTTESLTVSTLVFVPTARATTCNATSRAEAPAKIKVQATRAILMTPVMKMARAAPRALNHLPLSCATPPLHHPKVLALASRSTTRACLTAIGPENVAASSGETSSAKTSVPTLVIAPRPATATIAPTVTSAASPITTLRRSASRVSIRRVTLCRTAIASRSRAAPTTKTPVRRARTSSACAAVNPARSASISATRAASTAS
mmetsp:Transcript_5803/g.21133  ORF Transcript_5803/g.21133 Transcript_5803/m.21133 type:complete len:362 (+) Transcript_5803:673-1758(+)